MAREIENTNVDELVEKLLMELKRIDSAASKAAANNSESVINLYYLCQTSLGRINVLLSKGVAAKNIEDALTRKYYFSDSAAALTKYMALRSTDIPAYIALVNTFTFSATTTETKLSYAALSTAEQVDVTTALNSIKSTFS